VKISSERKKDYYPYVFWNRTVEPGGGHKNG
jgi:hypothetical protein